MQIVEFTFKDMWFDYGSFPMKVIRPYNEHDHTMSKHRSKWEHYLQVRVHSPATILWELRRIGVPGF